MACSLTNTRTRTHTHKHVTHAKKKKNKKIAKEYYVPLDDMDDTLENNYNYNYYTEEEESDKATNKPFVDRTHC